MPERQHEPLTPRELDLARAARAKGVSIRDVASAFQVSKSTMARLLKVEPLPENPEDVQIVMPINGLCPGSPPTLIRDGDRAYDVVSHRTGIEDHPQLKRDPRTDPKPEKKYIPGTPGGIGSVKTKPTWEVAGLEHTVTAWTKAEAKALFREYLRSRGEKGRFSVPIGNPKRVKTA